MSRFAKSGCDNFFQTRYLTARMILSAANKSFFLWVLYFRPKHLADLLRYTSSDVQNKLNDLVQKVNALGEREVHDFALRELKRLSLSLLGSYLPDVHDDWILHKLKAESPEVVSLVLRHLPADRVSRLLNLLPSDLLQKLPKISDSYAISAALSESIRQRFSGYFTYPRLYDPTEPFSYHSLIHLKPSVLRAIFLQLGYQEIALGLKLLPDRTKDLVLGKLLPKDRVAVERAMTKLKNASEARHKKAQVHIISQEVGLISAFVQEIGFLVFAKSVLLDDRRDVEVLCHKLSFAEAESLMRHVDVTIRQNSLATVLLYREEILNICKSLLTGKSGGGLV